MCMNTRYTVQDTYKEMQRKLGALLPDFDIRYKAELVYEINRLKKERGAIILGHNYMEPALFQTVPDIVGDSLELAKAAAKTNANPIIFCGVRFMAETAKIMNPDKTVLLPAKRAGCSLDASITAEDVRTLRAHYPGIPIVTYINTYADVKAECDACCTSSNAEKVVTSFGSKTVIFIPDEYLAKNVARDSKKHIIFPTKEIGFKEPIDNLEYTLIGWHGKCEVHEKFRIDDVKNIRAQF